MGQSPSFPAPLPESTGDSIAADAVDHTSSLPDECLSLIFHFLSSANRNRCSLVCKHWLTVDARSRSHLYLDANTEIGPHIPHLFSRFDSVTHLALRCPRESPSLTDDDLLSVSLRCPDLSSLNLIGCRDVSDVGIASLARNCKNLTEFSCCSCSFGIKGFNSVFEHCCMLDELIIVEHHTQPEPEPIITIIGSSKSLKSILLKKLKNGELFAPLIIGTTNLRELELVSCVGDWDLVLDSLINSNDRLVDIGLQSLSQLTDAALSSISNCANLEVLQAVHLPNCTNLGIVSVTERCKHLRKVYINCHGAHQIGDEGLAALGRNCINMECLILSGANPAIVSLEVIASSCPKLEELGLYHCETIRDSELSFLAGNCKALELLIIYSCPISDVGLTDLFWGFPNLKFLMFWECVEVSQDILHWLKMQRESLIVCLDSDEIELVEASTSEGARPQGSVWDVILLCYFLRITPRKQQSQLRSKFGSLPGSNR